MPSTMADLQERIEKLTFVLEGAGVGSWDWNLNTNAVAFDERWCTMLGLDPATTPMHLETWSSRVHPDDKAQAYRDVQAHIDGRTEQYENIHRVRHADGRWVWILDKGRITERDSEGKPVRFSGIHLDVSLQKSAEAELKDSRELLDLATRTFGVGIWEFSIPDSRLRWHPSMFELFGYPETSDEKLEEIFRKCVAPRDVEALSALFRDALAGNAAFEAEYAITRKNGESRILRTKGVIQTDGAGNRIRMIGLNRDITDERRRQQELERERMLNVHASRMATIGEMAGGIAHEINSPLSVITLRASQLRDYIRRRNPDPAKIEVICEALESTAHRIGRIIQAMKNLARDSSRDLPGMTRAADLLQDAGLIVHERFRLQSIDLQIRIDPPELTLHCRPTEISQAILNLIQNARDAIEDLPEQWIRIEVREHHPEVVFEITDSGSGLSAEARAHLFQPFFTTKPPGRGTGLGLGICRQIVERHGGSIEYDESCPNTRFRMKLPKQPPSSARTS